MFAFVMLVVVVAYRAEGSDASEVTADLPEQALVASGDGKDRVRTEVLDGAQSAIGRGMVGEQRQAASPVPGTPKDELGSAPSTAVTEPPTTPTTAAPTTRPPTTRPPTTKPPTTKPPTTTEPPVETTVPDTASTDTTVPVDPTQTTMPVDPTAPTETTVAPETTVPPAPTAPPTTAHPEGWVDAGHGVWVPAVLLAIRHCESHDNYTAANPNSTARGAYQFLTGSWKSYGHAARYGVSRADLATPAQQDEAALITWQRSGTSPWNASKSCWT